MTEVVLRSGGWDYSGWTKIDINRSVKNMAGEFSFETSERWSGGRNAPSFLLDWQRIREGDPAEVLYYGVPVVTGYVDVYQPRYGPQEHTASLQGRSKTGDPVDSSAIVPNGEFKKTKLDQLARTTLKPFGVGVKVEADTSQVIKRASVHPGETAHEFIERYARQQGILPTDDEYGDFRLLQVQDGGPVASLIEGVNILDAGATLRADKRHSDYQVLGQEQGDDQRFGKDVSGVIARTRDPAVTRYRPLQMSVEGEGTREAAQKRADWEAATRAGESVSADVTVWGWFYAPGALWTPGDKVALASPMLAINRVLAIESVNFTIDDGAGTISKLKLVPVEALNPQAGQAAAGGQGNDPAYSNTRPTQPATVSAWT